MDGGKRKLGRAEGDKNAKRVRKYEGMYKTWPGLAWPGLFWPAKYYHLFSVKMSLGMQ